MFSKIFQKAQDHRMVEIAPLVLLSVVDHYKRQSYQRVIGVLLGNTTNERVVIQNSFAVPFEESKNGFFLDTSYLENMFNLFYKVNNKEKIVGWYHSGPKMHKNDLEITKTMEIYCTNPLLAVVNVHLKTDDIPAQAYQLDENKQLVNLTVKIGADENEEVGVEHLLRDIKEGTGSTMKDKHDMIRNSLQMYDTCLTNIIEYIEKHEMSETVQLRLQEICNEMPKLEDETDLVEMYSGELVNCIVAMNDLIKNKSGFE